MLKPAPTQTDWDVITGTGTENNANTGNQDNNASHSCNADKAYDEIHSANENQDTYNDNHTGRDNKDKGNGNNRQW